MASVAVRFNGEEVELAANEREFKTKSKGYYFTTKLNGPDGKRYQTSITMVEIGSKPQA